LEPVKKALVLAKASGILVEITNLIIPTLNDKPEEIRQLTNWIKTNLGGETPLHFSRFFPRYKMRHLPPTSLKTLDMARDIAMEEGLDYVYIGNIQSKHGQNTYCPDCKKLLVERVGYTIVQNQLKDGCCPDCGKEIYGVWK
jgi:pyruvate formate lyase activating enzyme